MLGLNRVLLVGEVGERPEVRYTPEGSAVACFTIVVGRSWAGPGGRTQREAESFGVVAWRELGERCAEDLEPGMVIHVEGRLRNHTWRDVLGRQIVRTEVIAERVVVLETEDSPDPESRYDYEYQS